MKIVINGCHGGFGLSEKGLMRYAEIKGITLHPKQEKWGVSYYQSPTQEHEKPLMFLEDDIPRDDAALVQVVEEMGEEADGHYAKLRIVEIPDDVHWYIEEYDGSEWISEVHRTWR